jgi:hypothetical protein
MLLIIIGAFLALGIVTAIAFPRLFAPSTVAGIPEGQTLTGLWRCRHDNDAEHSCLCLIEFEGNGRFINNDGDTGTYTVRGHRLIFAFEAFPYSEYEFSFIMRENRLTLHTMHVNVFLYRD